MKINKITIHNFGKHHEAVIVPNSTLNIIFGKNESGKSTIQDFIKAMFYGLNQKARSISDNPRKKYSPWDGSLMSGEIDFEYNNRQYHLSRVFGATKKGDRYEFTDAVTGENIDIPAGSEVGEYIFGITSQTFENTVFIDSSGSIINSSVDKDGEMLKLLSNLAVTGNEDVSINRILNNISGAMSRLHSPRRDRGIIDKLLLIKSSLIEESSKVYTARCQCYESLNQLDSLNAEIVKLESELKALNAKKDLLDKQLANKSNTRLDDIKNTYRRLTELRDCFSTAAESGINEIEKQYQANKSNDLSDYFNELEPVLHLMSESRSSYNALNDELDQLSFIKNIDSNHIDFLSSEIKRLEEILSSRNNILDELGKEKEDLKHLETMADGNSSGAKKKPGLLKYCAIASVLTGTLLTVVSILFFGSNIPLAAALGIISFISYAVSLTCFILSRKSLTNQTSVVNDLRLRIMNTNNKISLLTNRLSELFNNTIDSGINSDNIDKALAEYKAELRIILDSAKCADISELHNLVSKYETTGIRLTEANNNLNKASELLSKAAKNVVSKLSGKASELQSQMLDFSNINVLSFAGDDYAAVLKQIDDVKESLLVTKEKYFSLQSALSSTFSNLRDEETIKYELSDVSEKIEQYEYNYDCLSIAYRTMEESFNELQQSFGPKLNEKTKDIFNMITQNNYSDIKIAKSFDIQVVSQDDLSLKDYEYLSSGTVEQLYFSLRLAISELLSDDFKGIPLFLDDTFSSFDDSRMEAAVKTLCNISDRQIFLFTCHSSILKLISSKDVNIINL